MHYHPQPLADLIRELQKLPSVGPKTAQRLAFYMLKAPSEDTARLATAISEVKTRLFCCGICGNITDREPCHICANPERDHGVICVIEEPDDLLAIERTNGYKGVYHVLMGVISPLDGIGPKDLRIDSLFDRIESQNIEEVILATNYTTEGQATSLYLTKRLSNLDLAITRISYGIPVGGDLEYIDELTLSKALEGRRRIDV
ncbi:MAG: recombination mediator RecR [Candidatus Poribacteria bacterium]|nr:recombination mediator RecR [Candidatus Poribacteria bacterium]MDE0504205.1 recombination mediator RecR [Candidatus Poribacteria bacterium]